MSVEDRLLDSSSGETRQWAGLSDQDRMALVLEAVQVGTWTYDIGLDRVFADRNLSRMFSVSDADAAGGNLQTYLKAIHFEDRARVEATIASTLESSDRFLSEYRIVKNDGSCRWVLARGVVERNASGKAVRLPGIILDITDKVLAEMEREKLSQELEQQKRITDAQFASMADTMPQIVWAAKPDGQLDYYNQRWYEYIDVRAEDEDIATWSRHLHPDDLQRAYDCWSAVLQSGEPYSIEFRVRDAGGAYRWFLVRALPMRVDGHIVRWFGTCTDIHEQHELQDRLEQSEALFRQLSDTIPQLAWMAHPDGMIFWYNHRWYEYTGRSFAEMEGEGWQMVHDPEMLPAVMEKWKKSLVTGEPFDMTFPLRGADGTFRPFLTRVMPMRDSHGEITLWFGTNTDVSEQKRMIQEREELLASERAARSNAEHASRMKDEFLATLSHELRTPLNAIFGWTQLLRQCEGDAETMTEGLDVIDRNVRMQTQLIEDLLDMSRIISGKLRLDVQPVALPSCIEAAIETVTPAADAKDIRIEMILDPHIDPVSGDPGRLQQVLWNLLSNAIKFTPRGGRVQVLLQRINSHIEVSVADSGEGIAPAFLPHVFDRFRQADAASNRRHGGLGLGLAIVKQLVELHGGHVRVKSAGKGQGTTFIVHLPVKVAHTHTDDGERLHPKSPSAHPSFRKNSELHGIHILVVDDEKDARELLTRILRECGAEVKAASSGREALQMLQEDLPQILISDVGMPEMDGYEFIRSVRSLPPEKGGDVPAIALTAFARSLDRTRALVAGFLSHVSKPVEPAELIANILALTSRTRR